MPETDKSDHERLSDRLQRETDKLAEQSDKLAQHIDDVDAEWRAKRQDARVAGANPPAEEERPAEDADD